MDLFKEGLSGNLVVVAVAGAAALALPVVVPSVAPALAPALRTAFKLGINLFLESESEMEGQFIQELVQDTLQGLLAITSGPGSAAQRRQAAAERIGDFESRVRTRAARFGWDEQDIAARYRRHVERLKQAIAGAKQEQPQSKAAALDHISGMITEDW